MEILCSVDEFDKKSNEEKLKIYNSKNNNSDNSESYLNLNEILKLDNPRIRFLISNSSYYDFYGSVTVG